MNKIGRENLLERKENQKNNCDEKKCDSLVNCDNKTNHCNRYVSNGLFSDQNSRSKLSNDDESSHPINASNTNNKRERKRNINMLLNDKDVVEKCGVGRDDDDDASDCTKRMKVDCDGQDNNKSKMYQVRVREGTKEKKISSSISLAISC